MSTLRLWTFALIAVTFLSTPSAARAAWNDTTAAPNAALYGSTAVFHSDTAVFPQWTDVMQRAARDLSHQRVCASAGDASCVPAEWRALIDELAGRPLMAQLEIVNRTFNALPYVTAWQNWHRPSYWETPFELLARGGQCEDYAIAKYLALHAAGVGDNAMRVLIVRDTDLGADHAVLAVDVNGTSYLLDNLDPRIRPVATAPQYRPYYAINLSGYWTYQGGRSELAAADGR
ncbi:MAG TPA: transglutaminase-like cysteine peptidase [Stellaceae bacterium]|nr:transglutaminase-like cysteine peptidase [Stellaceae bacterium]